MADSKLYDIREPVCRAVYFNMFQEVSPGSQFLLRTSMAPAAVVPEVLHTVHDRLKTVAVKRVTTMNDQIDETIIPERLIALLSGWFGALGAVLAAIGLYGLLAFTGARRMNEIGVRMALGATRGEVARMVLRDSLRMVCAGLLIGVPLAFWASRAVARMIPDLPAASLAAILLGAAGMIALALLATYLPASRGSRIDPLVALRCE